VIEVEMRQDDLELFDALEQARVRHHPTRAGADVEE
jgi:hypothetical protein